MSASGANKSINTNNKNKLKKRPKVQNTRLHQDFVQSGVFFIFINKAKNATALPAFRCFSSKTAYKAVRNSGRACLSASHIVPSKRFRPFRCTDTQRRNLHDRPYNGSSFAYSYWKIPCWPSLFHPLSRHIRRTLFSSTAKTFRSGSGAECTRSALPDISL